MIPRSTIRRIGDKPFNILLITSDQQRFDTVAALGNSVIRTPHLDRLCQEGTAFTRCYTPSPVCVPARASLATGLPPHLTHCVDNPTPPTGDAQSFMQTLSDYGYQTHGVGKMHFMPDYRQMWGFDTRDVSEEGYYADDDYLQWLRREGYTHVLEPHGSRSEYYYIPQPSQLPDSHHHSSWVADRSIDFMQRRDSSRPFLLWASFIKPHPPFESPWPWYKLYRTADMPSPRQFTGQSDLWSYWNHVQNRYKYRGSGSDDLLWRTIAAAYYACISFLDAQVGRILKALGDEIDNTLIVFTSDHGEFLGDYGCVGKRSMLDASARIPMIARLPGLFEAGKRCETPTSLIDVAATFRKLATGDNQSGATEAIPLQDVARPEYSERVVYSQFQQDGYGLHMAVDQHHKYIWSAADQRQWLFDLQADPLETSDCSTDAEQSHALQRLRDGLIKRYADAGYDNPLSADRQDWADDPQRQIPDDPDAGLLFQDPPQLEAAIEGLGPNYQPSRGSSKPYSACNLMQTETRSKNACRKPV